MRNMRSKSQPYVEMMLRHNIHCLGDSDLRRPIHEVTDGASEGEEMRGSAVGIDSRMIDIEFVHDDPHAVHLAPRIVAQIAGLGASAGDDGADSGLQLGLAARLGSDEGDDFDRHQLAPARRKTGARFSKKAVNASRASADCMVSPNRRLSSSSRSMTGARSPFISRRVSASACGGLAQSATVLSRA